MTAAALEGAAGTRVVTEALRPALMAGDLSPGQRLVEGDLAETYGVTLAAVRAALIELSAGECSNAFPSFHFCSGYDVATQSGRAVDDDIADVGC